jgi:hypothetical protein
VGAGTLEPVVDAGVVATDVADDVADEVTATTDGDETWVASAAVPIAALPVPQPAESATSPASAVRPARGRSTAGDATAGGERHLRGSADRLTRRSGGKAGDES